MKHKIYDNVDMVDDFCGNPIMDSFMKQYQHLYVKAKTWEEYSPIEAIIEMQNGDVYLYNWLERQICRIILITDSRELTEKEWRRGFSYWLDNELCKSRMSQYELARMADVSENTMSRYMTGRTTPNGYVLQRIADVLGCDVMDILPHDYIPAN